MKTMPNPDSIVSIFEKKVSQMPDAPALRWSGGVWTYAELNSKANRLAHFLIEAGVKSETPVGIFALRSPATLMSFLAVLKAGGAYVPIDPAYPADRVRFYLEDAGIPIVLVDPVEKANLPESAARTILLEEPLAADSSDANPGSLSGPGSLAHVLYTSGSTGRPKGVLIEHRGVIRLTQGVDYVDIKSTDVFLQNATLSFDISTFEIWGAWLNGACVAVPPSGKISLSDLASAYRTFGVTMTVISAGIFHLLVEQELESLASLRYLLTGGEVVSPSDAERFLKRYPGANLINAYGPTENSVFTTCHNIRIEDPMPVRLSIGRPIKGGDVRILDEKLQPVKPGVAGELVLTGSGLARGYLNQPELTAHCFIEVTDSSGKKVRGYRSGDMGCFKKDGTIDFLGRMDDQVKINGLRIEPGEIKNTLQSHPQVSGAEVVVVENAGRKRLEIFAVLRAGGTVEERQLRDFLRKKIPGNWLPRMIHLLPELPLTANGKVDRAALVVRLSERRSYRGSNDDTEPSDYVEKEIWNIWRDVLPGMRITRTDSFVDLGGSSLAALEMIARVEKVVGHKLGLRVLLEGGTIADIANAVRQTQPAEPPPIMMCTQPGNGTKPPFFFAHGDYICGGLYCQRMARRLPSDQPFYALAPYGTFGRKDLPTTFEEAAVRYVKMIRSVQPKGPYYLGGFCNGAVAMYEVAQQLIQAGETVAALVLLDPPDLYFFLLRRKITAMGKLIGLPERKCRALYQRIAEGIEIWQYHGFMRFLREFAGRTTKWIAKLFRSSLQPSDPEPASLVTNLNFHYYEVMASYEPKTYLGSKEVWIILRLGESDRCPRQMSYWSGFIPDVHFEVIPGTHLELQNSMGEIAGIINKALAHQPPSPPDLLHRVEISMVR